MSDSDGGGNEPGFLEADPVVRARYDDVLEAVSAGFIQWEDVKSNEWASQIRMLAGIRACRKSTDKKVALLNMAYAATYLLATSDGRFEYDSFKSNDESFHGYYRKAHAALAGIEEADDAKPTSVTQEMVNLYNYLFT